MNNPVRNFCIAIMAALHGAAAAAYTTSIADTSGYVVQSADDGTGQSSIVSGSNFPGGAPVPGKDYLAANGRISRTPAAEKAANVFAGRSFSLDGGANFILKGKDSSIEIGDFRIYNALVSQGDGNSDKTLKGALSVFGSPDAPSIFQGSGNGGVRRMYIDSDISGAAGTCIQVRRTPGDGADGSGAQFYCFLRGDNSGFAGSVDVVGGGNGVCLAVADGNALGAARSLRLDGTSGPARLFGASADLVSLDGAEIAVDAGATIGVYTASGTATGLSVGDGSTVTGSGTLTIQNSGANGTTHRAVELGAVAISGISAIETAGTGILRLGAGYSNPGVAIAVNQTAAPFAVAGGAATGPLSLSSGTVLEKALAAAPLVVNGNLSIAATPLTVHFPDTDISALSTTNAFRVLSAANLGTDGGLSASDFAAAASASAVGGGSFSLEKEDGAAYLVYTLAKAPVFLTGSDAAGNGEDGSSFNAAARWSDTRIPHGSADYFVPSGKQLRAPDGIAGTFGGDSLTILPGGIFSAQGAEASIADLRLSGGSVVNATRASGSAISGAVAVDGTAAPALFQLSVYRKDLGGNETSRSLDIRSDISGAGCIRFGYDPAASGWYLPHPDYPGAFRVSGGNAGFSGEWQIAHFAVKVSFADAAAIGGASAIRFVSNGVFRAERDMALPASLAVNVDATGNDAADTAKSNGGSFEVDGSATLAVTGEVSGSGILRKSGTGTLVFTGDVAKTGEFNVKAGTVVFGGAFTNGNANAIVRTGAAIGGAGTVKKAEFEDGAGIAVDPERSEPLSIGTLVLDGALALRVSGAAVPERFPVAKVDSISGSLPETAVARSADGRSRHVNLTLADGVIYASSVPFVLVVR